MAVRVAELVEGAAKRPHLVGTRQNGRHVDAWTSRGARQGRRDGAHDTDERSIVALGLSLRVEVIAGGDAEGLAVEGDEAEGEVVGESKRFAPMCSQDR
jgi:hypothetical protein